MKILLDTHILLWYLWGDKSLSEKCKMLIDNPENTKLFSIASLWEIAIKNSIGKLALKGRIEDLVPEQVILLPIKPEHIYRVQQIPFLHKDPFDRLLASQSMIENIPLLSADEIFDSYDLQRIF